ncbi:MAG: hypothetical protein ACYDAG_11110 [Chloroflexota bacterium]
MSKRTGLTSPGEDLALRLVDGADPLSFAPQDLLASIDGLVLLKSVEAADVLARIDQPKELAKAARKGLFRLRSQGIRPSLSRQPELPAPPTRQAPVLSLVEARVSSYDPRGTRAIFLLAEKPFTGLISLLAIVNDGDGVLDAEMGATTKKAFHTRLENFRGQFDYIEFVSIPPSYANELIDRGSQRNERSRHPLPQDLSVWKTVSAGAPAWEGLPPIFQLLSADEVRERVPLDSTRDLADTEFAAWGYGEEHLKEYVVRLDTARGGPLVVSADAQRGREQAIVDEATDAIFQGDELERARERLSETAYLLFQQENRPAAEQCLRAAVAVGESPSHEHPFLRQIVVKSFDQVTGDTLGEAEANREQASEAARTESGIILPG